MYLEADVREERITKNLTAHIKFQLAEMRKQLVMTSQTVDMRIKALDSMLTPVHPHLEN